MKMHKQLFSLINVFVIFSSLSAFAEDEKYSPKVLTTIIIQNGSVTQKTHTFQDAKWIQSHNVTEYTSNGKTIGRSLESGAREVKIETPYNIVEDIDTMSTTLSLKNPAQKNQVLEFLKNNPHTTQVVGDVKKMMQEKIEANDFYLKEIESIENQITIYNLAGMTEQPMKFSIKVNFRNNILPQKNYIVSGDAVDSRPFSTELDKYNPYWMLNDYFHLDINYKRVPKLKNTDFKKAYGAEHLENVSFTGRYNNAAILIKNELWPLLKQLKINSDTLNELEQDSR
jgi:hypothetical protein